MATARRRRRRLWRKCCLPFSTAITAGYAVLTTTITGWWLSIAIAIAIALTLTLARNLILAPTQVVHRDIKLDNMIFQGVEEESELKMIDFGFANLVRPGREGMYEQLGTPSYMAPELWERADTKAYNSAVDIWALGVCAYMLLSGTKPFYHKDLEQRRWLIRHKPLEFPTREWEGVSNEGRDFCQQLLNKKPEKRPSASEAIAHTWCARRRTRLGSRGTPRTPYRHARPLRHRLRRWLVAAPRLPAVARSCPSPPTCGCPFLIRPCPPRRIQNRSQLHSGPDAAHELARHTRVVASLESFAEAADLKRLALEVLAFNSPPAQLEELRALFHKMDTDDSGTLSLAEFKKVIAPDRPLIA